MMKREIRGGDLNLIRLLRHDLPSEEQLPTLMDLPRRVVVSVLTMLAALMTAIHFFLS